MVFASKNSLTWRLFAFSTFAALIALVVVIILLSEAYKRSEERAFHDLLNAHLLALISQTQANKQGQLKGVSELGFPGFQRPLSGWYWQVSGEDEKGEGLIFKSPSLVEEALTLPPISDNEPKFERFEYLNASEVLGSVLVLETRILLGESELVTNFIVAGPRDLVRERVASFTLWLVVFLSAFALFIIIANLVAVRFGLRPLAEITSQLEQIRSGQRSRLSERVPSEIAPLSQATNSLIDTNKDVIERARAQVGNLAHALKTPIAVLQNESEKGDFVAVGLVKQQTDSMKVSVQRYLDKARIAAQRATVSNSTDVIVIVGRMVRVMQKLYPDIMFDVNLPKDHVIFYGESQDLEEILGNLFENAARFAVKCVSLNVIGPSGGVLCFTVTDDGPGLTDKQMQDAVKRGKRLDETTPGSGLGLAIVSEITSQYGGEMKLKRAINGGLEVVFKLPGSSPTQ